MRPEGRQLQGEPLLQEELIKNTDSESFGFGRGEPGNLYFSPAPARRPASEATQKPRGQGARALPSR